MLVDVVELDPGIGLDQKLCIREIKPLLLLHNAAEVKVGRQQVWGKSI
jgi:hypothetical protein